MNEDITQTDNSLWFSTYGLLTANRVLGRFNIHIENDELIVAMKNLHSVYYQLLRVPLKNIFNGIILQQTHDYQVYAQKLFIDYLLSGAGSKEDESPGANTRDDLEVERVRLIEVGEAFNREELAHQQLIAESQATLIQLSLELERALTSGLKKIRNILRVKGINKDDKSILKAIRVAMIHYTFGDDEILAVSSSFWVKMAEVLESTLNNELRQELAGTLKVVIDAKKHIQESLSPFIERTNEMGVQLRSFRRQFYDLILRVTGSLKYLPDYHVDEEREKDNRSSLYFDSLIGGE